MSNLERFNQADKYMTNGKWQEAAEIYLSLEKDPTFAPLCFYRMAFIMNAQNDPVTAYELYYRALTEMPNIAAYIFDKTHSSSSYVFQGKKDELEITECPLCKKTGVPYWCYPLFEALEYNSFINPIRMWMYCEDCHHIYAREIPKEIFLHNDSPRNPEPFYFSYYSDILSNIRQYASGMKLFEVGIGAGECLLSAREIGYETFGIDVIERHVEYARTKFGLNAETHDFVEFRTDGKWDIIIMGDVIEHVSDPIKAMKKAAELLTDNGAVWVSTPNFESAFSCVCGHADVMRKQQYHINYFSRESFFGLLERVGLTPVEYRISAHYNGSMEVIAVKSERFENE